MADLMRLHDDDVDRIAYRLLELLEERDEVRPTTQPQLVDAGEIARLLDITRETVYDHAAEMGGRKIGRLWRFDANEAAAWKQNRTAAAPAPAAEAPSPSPRRRRSSSTVELLEVGPKRKRRR